MSHPTNPITGQRRSAPPHNWASMNKKLKSAIYLETSKYLLDLSKLIFGGIILANIMSLNIDKILTFVVGTFTITVLSALSFMLFKKGKE